MGRLSEINTVQSSLLRVEFLNLRYVVSFRNHNASKATGVENRGRILLFDPHVKFRGEMGEMSESISRVQPRLKPVIYF